jgi:DNA end-binding protein Ku
LGARADLALQTCYVARAISSATISFGLVSIPVKLYPATQPSSGVAFHLLHAKCGTRVKQQYVCPHDSEIVPRDQMIKGYEFAKEQYVTFTPEELKALEEKATQSIDIAHFIPREQVDPLYFDKPYYLGPEKGGEKAYRLLATVMQESDRAAVARYAARGKQYIVMLRASDAAQGGAGIVMQTLLYADEVRSFSEVPVATAEVKEAEVKLAKQLVEQIAAETFDPNEYQDDVRKRIEADIERKVAGKEIAASPEPAQTGRVIDLMQALKASLDERERQESAPVAAPEGAQSEEMPEPTAGARMRRKPARQAESAQPGEEAAPSTAKAEHRRRASKR